MKLSQYMKRLEVLSKAPRKLVCMYCGAKTAALRDLCMCSNCEGVARYGSAALSGRDPMLASSLELIDGAMAEANYGRAIAEYEKLYQYRKDPAFLYAEALVYIKYSNHENAKISYDRPGFMEDNAAVSERSLNLASAAKALLAKAIGTSRADIAEGNSSPDNLYTLLLAQLKFGNLRGARDSLDEIEKLGGALMYNYAAMLFEARMGNYKQVMEHADTIIRSDEALVNAFFYAGLAMFKLGGRTDAKKLLKAVSEVSANSSIPALIDEMRTAELI
jgi:tetratricopeptide (TPR) repeat protein